MTIKTSNSSNRSRSKTSSDAAPKTGSWTPSKLDRLITLLRQTNGASLEELCTVTGWQAHSVRGAIAGSLKKKGHVIMSERTDGVRRYRIGDPQ